MGCSLRRGAAGDGVQRTSKRGPAVMVFRFTLAREKDLHVLSHFNIKTVRRTHSRETVRPTRASLPRSFKLLSCPIPRLAAASTAQFAMGHCRGLPVPPSSTPPAAPDSEEEGGVGGSTEEGPDPAKEILATIGADNTGKYLVASQVYDAMVVCGSSCLWVVWPPCCFSGIPPPPPQLAPCGAVFSMSIRDLTNSCRRP